MTYDEKGYAHQDSPGESVPAAMHNAQRQAASVKRYDLGVGHTKYVAASDYDRAIAERDHWIDVGNTTVELLKAAIAERDAAQRFKDWVHDFLDSKLVPKDPDPEGNAKHGCRISGRLQWVFDQLDAAQRECERLKHLSLAKLADWQNERNQLRADLDKANDSIRKMGEAADAAQRECERLSGELEFWSSAANEAKTDLYCANRTIKQMGEAADKERRELESELNEHQSIVRWFRTAFLMATRNLDQLPSSIPRDNAINALTRAINRSEEPRKP